MYEVGSTGITFIPDFMTVSQVVQKFKAGNTLRQQGDLMSLLFIHNKGII